MRMHILLMAIASAASLAVVVAWIGSSDLWRGACMCPC